MKSYIHIVSKYEIPQDTWLYMYIFLYAYPQQKKKKKVSKLSGF